jgi:hypothetical protein
MEALRPHADEIIATAERVVSNELDLLGSGRVALGHDLDWHLDFKSGNRWKPSYHTEIDQMDLGRASDVKVPWDLARFHQALWLGQAYWLTDDVRYVQKFVVLVESWISQNPFGFGIHWTNAMESSIRAANWIVAAAFFVDSKEIAPAFWLSFYRELFHHGDFIRHNLEVERVVGNHYFLDAVGLVFLGSLFADSREGRAWFKAGAAILEQEVARQFRPDGVNYEQATSYHRLVVESFAAASIVLSRNGAALSLRTMTALERSFEFMHAYLKPGGQAPVFSDSDNGRLFRFADRNDFNDHRSTLAIGASLFRRADFAHASAECTRDVLFLLGRDAARTVENAGRLGSVGQSSRAFRDSGYYVLRADDAYLMFDAGPLSHHDRGGHGHLDTFSFELAIGKDTFIVDSGTPCYTSDAKLHAEFASTQAHNTVTVDGQSVAKATGIWAIDEDSTNPKLLRCEFQQDRDIVEAEHYGFVRLQPPVVHRRTISFEKAEPCWQIEDKMLGFGEHEFEIAFHVPADIEIEVIDSRAVLLRGNAATLQMRTTYDLDVKPCTIAPTYGVLVPGTRISAKSQASAPFRFVTSFEVVERRDLFTRANDEKVYRFTS